MRLSENDPSNRLGMQGAPTIPIGMQLLGRFRNDAHTALDSPAGRNFVIKKERRHWYFSFGAVSYISH